MPRRFPGLTVRPRSAAGRGCGRRSPGNWRRPALDRDDLRDARGGDPDVASRRSGAGRPAAPDRARRAPHHPGLLGARVALAVLGAGVPARAQHQRFPPQGGEVVGHLGAACALLCRQRAAPGCGVAARVDRVPGAPRCAGRDGGGRLRRTGAARQRVVAGDARRGDRQGRSHQPAGRGGHHHAAGGAAMVQHRHGRDEQRPVPGRGRHHHAHLSDRSPTRLPAARLPNLRARLAEMSVRT